MRTQGVDLPRFYMNVEMMSQPDEITCGPTALHAVYRYFGTDISLEKVIQEVHKFEDGGTLAVWLGCHALSLGYRARLYTCNLQLFDPSWFSTPGINLEEKLCEQMKYKSDEKLVRSSNACIDFLKLGGEIRLEDLTRRLLRKYLSQGCPILTGLSSTFLYQSMREAPPEQIQDDIRGVPTGHFVVLSGYDRENRLVCVVDPLEQNPYSSTKKYEIPIDRVISAIHLGILTYDANFLIIYPNKKEQSTTLLQGP
jgi:hypothetical protein